MTNKFMKYSIIKSLGTCLLAFLVLFCPVFSQIQQGTALQITIQGVPKEEQTTINGMYPVSESGTINLPYVGTMRAAGLSPEVLASSIQTAYKEAQIYNNPTIQVIWTAEGAGVREQVVHVGGYVRKPGPVQFQRNLTIWQAVQAAGGASEFGSLKRVKLYRAGKIQTYDIDNVEFKQIRMQPDDTLEVPEKNLFGG